MTLHQHINHTISVCLALTVSLRPILIAADCIQVTMLTYLLRFREDSQILMTSLRVLVYLKSSLICSLRVY